MSALVIDNKTIIDTSVIVYADKWDSADGFGISMLLKYSGPVSIVFDREDKRDSLFLDIVSEVKDR